MIKKIDDLQLELESLPKGTIVWKSTSQNKDVKKPYLQWREEGKTKSKYIPKEALDQVTALVDRRRAVQEEIRSFTLTSMSQSFDPTTPLYCLMNIAIGNQLKEMVKDATLLQKRNCFSSLEKYLYSPAMPRICSLYGLRRSGKTTLLYQLIGSMTKENFQKAAYIKAVRGQTMAMLDHDLKALFDHGYSYVFIDEITFLEDFIDTASILSDIYATMGMKIIISGTDSLGIWLSSKEELYDRTYMIHTTWIPYAEHARLLGTSDVDTYIEFGGTLRAGEKDFDDEALMTEDISFRDDESTRRYVDTAICKNIQHSLKNYDNGSRFMHLQELYDANELTNAINRIIESMNHRFVLQVLTQSFVSSDLKLAKKNLLKEKDLAKRTDNLEHIEMKTITEKLMSILSIINTEDATIGLRGEHVREIKDYLLALDLIEPCPIEYQGSPENPGENILILQPGMRYCQAQALVHALLKDPAFGNLSYAEKEYVCSKILDEVRGRMLEEIVLIESKRLLGKSYHVFKYQFIGGEYDMVIYDKKRNTCQLFEIKHSRDAVKEQCIHLLNADSCSLLESRFGPITGKYVLYRGSPFISDWGIEYVNVSEYLKQL